MTEQRVPNTQQPLTGPGLPVVELMEPPPPLNSTTRKALQVHRRRLLLALGEVELRLAQLNSLNSTRK